MVRDAAPDVPLHGRRRQRLLDSLGDGLLLLPTSVQGVRNGDVHFEFRPGSDFHFLTGFPEPEAVLVAWRTGRGRHRTVWFVRPRDIGREIWEGRRCGLAAVRRRYGADEAHPIAELWRRLPDLLVEHGTLFHRLGRDAGFDQRLLEVFAQVSRQRLRQNAPAHPAIMDPTPAIAELRMIKDQAELAALRRAAAITVDGHRAAMASVKPGQHEYEAQAVLEAVFRGAGSVRNGYPSIVASGPNSCILHYHDNDRKMKKGDLLLIDAGAEIGGSTADVTRTFPVSGTFTEPQAAVYGVVLRAQLLGIGAVKPGAAWEAPHRKCQRELTRGLVALGVLQGDIPKLVEKGAFRPWYMHDTSHWLGRDVHDVGAYQDDSRAPVRLRPGSVMTVEPGLYFGPRDQRVPKELRGIGIRIEDDVLVTARGHEVLTDALPKSVAAIEAACRAGG